MENFKKIKNKKKKCYLCSIIKIFLIYVPNPGTELLNA